MRPVTVMIDNNYNIIPDTGDKRYMAQMIRPNTYLECKLVKKRNLKHHRKYWGLMNALSFHFENTPSGWHMYFKMKFLELEEFILPTGKKILFPSSIAFEKMNQLEFDHYYKQVESHLAEKGFDVDELINTMEV